MSSPPQTQRPVQDITVRDRDRKFGRPTNEQHKFRLLLNHAYILEVEDVHFHWDSAVMLPDYGACDPNVDPADANHVAGLDAIHACYLHAENMPSNVILIAGHTDRSGSPDYNLGLSDYRSKNVHHVLMGEKPEWVDICDAKHKTEDVQQILIWIKGFFGWDTDPGPKNNVWNAQTQTALRKFQEQYNAAFNQNIAVDGVLGKQTWGAFFDMYMAGLKQIMQTDDAGLAAARGRIKFLDSARHTVGCGENWPITPDLVENQRSQIDRRVHVLFFDPPEVPELECHPIGATCDPAKCQLYGPNRIFRFDPLPCNPHEVGRRLRIRLEYGEIDKIFPDVAAATHTDDGVRKRLQAIGFLYEPLNSANIGTIAQHAWDHFKTVTGIADDAAAVEELKTRVRNVILADGQLPGKDELTRIRLPGVWAVTNADLAGGFFGNPATPAGTPHRKFQAETAAWNANDALGLLPIVAIVEERDGETWGPAAAGHKVHFQLIPPDDAPSGSFAGQPPLRTAPVTNSQNNSTTTTPPTPFTFNMTGHPKRYIDDERNRNPAVANDPQVDNAHRSVGGKRGGAVAGANRAQNVLMTGPRAGFHDALNLVPASASSHANAVMATTNDEGKACVILMPARTCGDRYKIRAFLDPISEAGDDQPSNGSEPFAVKEETGTMVVWRVFRLSKYMRWDYPGAGVNPNHAAEFALCGGALNNFDTGGFIADEYAKAWLDVEVESLAQSPQNISQADWLQAIRFAKGRINPTLSQRYNLNVLIAENSPVSPGTNNSSSGLIQFLTAAQYDAAPKGPPPPGGWPAATGNANFLTDLAAIMHAMSAEIMEFFTHNAISGLSIVQAPVMTSVEAQQGFALLGHPSGGNWLRSGWGGMRRGCYVTFGNGTYSNAGFPYDHNSNALHETGHTMYGPHQYTDAAQVNTGPGGSTGGGFDEHDYHDLCVMGYMSRRPGGQADFCGRCLLLLAGWDTHGMPPNPPGP